MSFRRSSLRWVIPWAFLLIQCGKVPLSGGGVDAVGDLHNTNNSMTRDDKSGADLFAPPGPHGTPQGDSPTGECLPIIKKDGTMEENPNKEGDVCLKTFIVHVSKATGRDDYLINISGQMASYQTILVANILGQGASEAPKQDLLYVLLKGAPIQVSPPDGPGISIQSNEKGCFWTFFYAMPGDDFSFTVNKPPGTLGWEFPGPVTFNRTVSQPGDLPEGYPKVITCALPSFEEDQTR